jgi:hypothetical protein
VAEQYILKKKKTYPQLRLTPIRSQEAEKRYFTGPFGLWVFPLVNLFLALIESIKYRAYPSTAPERRRRMTVFDITRDASGRIISIVEREVEE